MLIFLKTFLLIVPSICYFLLGLFFYMNKGVDYGYTLNEFITFNKYIFYSSVAIGITLAKLLKYLNIKYFNNMEGSNLYVLKFQRFYEIIIYSILLINLSSLFWMIVFNLHK